jgi:DHA2 family metal-tetracycline-proton antiporter-like MFS transporter
MRLMLVTVTISSMNAQLFHAVLPKISEEFGLTLAQASWLTSAYTLIYAFGTVTYGKLADRFQLKTLLTFGLSLFAAGSCIGLVSTSFAAALVGRCLQSAGAAAVPALSLIIPVRYFAPERRGSALSMTAVGVALGSALAPFVSAFIVSAGDWRRLFLPSLLLPALLPLYRKQLAHEPKEAPGGFDWIGGSLLAASVALILIGAAERNGWCLAAGPVLLLLFNIRIRTAKAPFLDPQLLADRAYVAGLALAFCIAGIGISLYFVPPILLAQVHGLDAHWIGFAMVPAAFASSLLGRLGGKLADRRGNAFAFTFASGLLIAGFTLLSAFAARSPAWVALFLIFSNVGQSFMQIAMSNTVSRTLPADRAGAGMGLFSMTSFAAQGIGAVVYGLALEHGSALSRYLPAAGSAGGAFGPIFLVSAVLHIGILLVYRRCFIPGQAALREERRSS